MSDEQTNAPTPDEPQDPTPTPKAEQPAPAPAPTPAPAPAPEVTLGRSAPPTAPARASAPAKADAQGWYLGTGRRKTAVARVRIKPGSGDIKIRVSTKKHKTVDDYFSETRDRNDVIAPLKATDTFGKLDVVARVDGGGYMGQAQAIRLGIARALKGYDPQLEGVLRDRGYLTRDPREVERKKYGQRGARRRFQFSKR